MRRRDVVISWALIAAIAVAVPALARSGQSAGPSVARKALRLARENRRLIRRLEAISPHIPSGAVTTAKIADNAVNGRKVADGSLMGADINLFSLGTVPEAADASHADDADAVAGHPASCPAATTLIRGLCFDSDSNGPASSLQAAADACAAKGGFLPTTMQLYSARGILNLGTGMGNDQQLTDDVFTEDAGATYWTIAVDGTGTLERQQISSAGKFYCAYPLLR